MKQYLIAGGGMAGLSLAWHILHETPDPENIQLTIIDREAKNTNDRTWCFWHQGQAPFAEIAVHDWSELLFTSPGYTADIKLEPWHYSMVRGIDFYTRVQTWLLASGRVRMVRGSIRSILDGPDQARVELDLAGGDKPVTETFVGDFVFDGTFHPSEYSVPPGYHDLKQHFRGWFVETDRDVFTPNRPTMFDLHFPQDTGFRFMYVLPSGPRKALVEMTWFSKDVLNATEYDRDIEAWLRDRHALGPGDYRIGETEQGVIPMTDKPFPRRLGERIMTIGTKGGRVKASTGFTFYRTQKDCLAIARKLARGESPFSIPKDPLRYRVFDTMLLHILHRSPARAAQIFSVLFRKNPIGRLFRFLNEEGTWPENLALMWSVPWWPFIRAWFVAVLFRRI